MNRSQATTRIALFGGETSIGDGLGTHRFTLWREACHDWQPVGAGQKCVNLALGLDEPGAPFVLFTLLNPSTATDERNDRTVSRCIEFTKAWGFKALAVANAYAWRATKPEMMFHARDMGEDIVGRGNDEIIRELAGLAVFTVAGWGGNIEPERQAQLVAMIPRLHALEVNVDHTPKHPLYVLGTAKPFPFGLPAPGDGTSRFSEALNQGISPRRVRWGTNRTGKP